MFYFNESNNYLSIREGVGFALGRKPKGLNNIGSPYAIRLVGILLSTT